MSEENKGQVATPAGIDIPASAVATCAQLVALLRDACSDLPMEVEPGDFLVELERNASPGERS